MSDQLDDVLNEFIIETAEYIDSLDRELITGQVSVPGGDLTLSSGFDCGGDVMTWSLCEIR